MRLSPLLALLLLTPAGLSQGFNVDVGDNLILFPAPSDSYGAAAGQSGNWNVADPAPGAFVLDDLSGVPSAVTIETDTFTGFNVFPAVIPTPDDQKLMEDTQWLPNLGQLVTWRFDGLANGDYDVYTYAANPASSTTDSEITVVGSSDPPQACGGLWPGGHVLGTTYTKHTVTVTTGSIAVHAMGIGAQPNDSGALNGFQIVPLGVGTIGTSYCGPAVANSSGNPAVITATGSVAVAANDVTLSATGLPMNQFGYFLNSMTQGFVQNPGGSQGNLCLGGQIGRYNATIFNSGSAGAGSLVLDLPNTPIPTGTTSISAGETWNFTCWYRDQNPGSTSNFTDGLSVLFQ